jgi:AraC family transcriptional regulator
VLKVSKNVWGGWPLSSCRFEASGCAEAHIIPVDTLLVWSGGKSLVEVQCGGREYVVERHSGVVDFLPAGVVIDRVRWQGQPTGCIAVVLPPAQLEALGVERPRRLEAERRIRMGLTDSHVTDLVHRLHARASDGQALGALYVNGLSLTLASYVYASFGPERESTSPPDPGLSPSLRRRLVALIDERIAEPMQMRELAAEVGYSQTQFLRLFSASFGLSPHHCVIRRRIERAKSILKDPECSLVTVAFECGFSSQAHFSTVFKHHTGVTPGRYRNDGLAESRQLADPEVPTADAALAREDDDARRAQPVERVSPPSGNAVPRGTCPATLSMHFKDARPADHTHD